MTVAYDSRTDRAEPTFARKAERAQRRKTEPKRQRTRASQRAALRGYGMDDR